MGYRHKKKGSKFYFETLFSRPSNTIFELFYRGLEAVGKLGSLITNNLGFCHHDILRLRISKKNSSKKAFHISTIQFGIIVYREAAKTDGRTMTHNMVIG